MSTYRLVTELVPSGDQPDAIRQLAEGVQRGDRYQTLLGVTGSGKTFTISNVIAGLDRPVLVMSHNKTLAAQLYSEFKWFFPNDRVEFFISYYDYYQPEAYVPSTDTYIAKDASINDEIDRLRLRATSALLSGDRNVIVVASVSCIYGIGAPEEWASQMVVVRKGEKLERNDLLRKLLNIYYTRNDFEFVRGTMRVRGDVVEVIPAYENEEALRIEFFGDVIERISYINRVDGAVLGETDYEVIYPAKQFVTSKQTLERAIRGIEEELEGRLTELRARNKLVEAQRLEQRTRFDIEMMREVGYCSGIENYSRHIAGRPPGSRPALPPRLFPEGFPPGHRRIARHGAADRRDVPRRPVAQGDARRTRLPAPVGAGQPSAHVRRMGGDGPAGDLRQRHAGRLRASGNPRAWSWNRSSARPAWSTPRWRSAPSRTRSTI